MSYFKNIIILFKIGLTIFISVLGQEGIKAQNCNFLEGEAINLNVLGHNTDAAYRQIYAIISNDTIIEIANRPSFSQQNSGIYYVYALNYDTTSSINNFVVGEDIANLSGDCIDTTRLRVNVCSCSKICHSDNGSISINNTGYNTSAGFSQIYILADTSGIISHTIENPITTTPLFSNIPLGHYHLYAINYDTSSLLIGIGVGNNISAVNGDCFDIAGAFCYNVCISRYDFGDLPDVSDSTTTNDYQTLLANNGPRHLILDGLFLGDSIDTELDGQQNNQALGDGIDEDGITIYSTMDLVAGITFRLPFTYTNLTGDTAHLEAWADWNGDGDFDFLNEMVIDWEDADTPFPNMLEITIPKNAATETTIGLRIRLSLEDNMSPYGLINSGEIEDYVLYLNCPKTYFPFNLTSG